MNENQESYFDEQRIFESVNRFEEMLKKDLSCYFDVFEFEYIVDYYMEQLNINNAKVAIERGLKQHPHSSILRLRLAQIYIQNGKPSKGLYILRNIEAVESSNSEFFLIKGTAFNVLGRQEEAHSAFDKSIKLAYEGKDDVILSIAYSYLNTRRYKLAIKYLLLSHHVNPKNLMAIQELAIVYERLDMFEESIMYYLKYLELEPYAENIWYNLGMVYSSKEEFDKAIEAYDFAIAICPDYVSAYFSKANTYVNRNQYKEAIKTYEEIIFSEADNAQVYTYIGECYEKLNLFKHAIQYYKKSLELDDTYSDAWLGIGMAFYHLNEYTKSLQYLKHSNNLDPENPDCWFMLGEVYRKMEMFDKSIESYKSAVELDPNDYEAWLSHAEIYFNEDRLVEAIDILKKAYQYNKEIASINYNLAAYYLYNNQPHLACEFFERGLTINYTEHNELLLRYPITSTNKKISLLISKYKYLSR